MKIGEIYISNWGNTSPRFGGWIPEATRYGEHAKVDQSSAAVNRLKTSDPHKNLSEYKSVHSIGIAVSYGFGKPEVGSISPYRKVQDKFRTTITFKRPISGLALADALMYLGKETNIANIIDSIAKRKDLLDDQLYQVTNVLKLDKFKAHLANNNAADTVYINSISFNINIKVGSNKRVCECGHNSTTTRGWIKHRSTCDMNTRGFYRLSMLAGEADTSVLYEKLESHGLITWIPVEMEPCVTTAVRDMLNLAEDGTLGLSGDGLIAKLDELIDMMDEAKSDPPADSN